MEKHYLSAQDLLVDSFSLAVKIYESGFRPTLIIGVWRGGTPVAIAVQEYFEYQGIKTDHIAIRASSYTGINQQSRDIQINGLEYIFEHTGIHEPLLIIDDVFDSGRSIEAILRQLEIKSKRNIAETVKVACPWYKPNNNKTRLKPDFYLHETDAWLVFPHELVGLTEEEIKTGKKEISKILGQ